MVVGRTSGAGLDVEEVLIGVVTVASISPKLVEVLRETTEVLMSSGLFGDSVSVVGVVPLP